ncbi:hypothetical protein [Cognatishimia activa]|uniref:hypothetical protein n=1 Tax=Cognatishimia activa TaxID=1715691 RepID=UPI0022318396|nr:hypothetical protein [Cognatishimia activa]UZD90323.1 hypothetical protein M0D42_12100 [Cognatishimia activa]
MDKNIRHFNKLLEISIRALVRKIGTNGKNRNLGEKSASNGKICIARKNLHRHEKLAISEGYDQHQGS